MKPWIGKQFQEQAQKILILGESWYGEFKRDDEIHTIDTWILRKEPGKSDRFFSRIYNAANPKSAADSSEKERAIFWNKVAFTNLVSESVGEKARIRPGDAHWQKGARRLEKLLPIIKCNRIFVLGNDTSYYAAPIIERLGIKYISCPHPSGWGVTLALLKEKWIQLVLD